MTLTDAIATYEAMGLNVLPAHRELGHPEFTFADLWEKRVRFPPARYIDRNLQVMSGVRWNLVVFDVDGDQGREQWDQWMKVYGCPPTWRVQTGGGGLHVWFRLRPRDRRLFLPKALVWGVWDAASNRWRKHQAIERLCDRSLVTAPPSLHRKTGLPYEFLDGPASLPAPAVCPAWLLELPAHRAPRVERPASTSSVAFIAGKERLAAAWGLRFAGRTPNAGGWLACRRIDGDDRRPSASFNVNSGVYCEFGPAGPETLPFLALAVRLGAYPSVEQAAMSLASV